MDVGIIGGSGYGGGELARLLEHHPSFKLRTVAARTHAGQTLGAVFPNLAGSPSAGLQLVPADPAELDGCAVVFLATPRDASRELAPALLGAGAVVVDFSDAFRLDAAPLAAASAGAAYGLPELYRAHLAGARLVANPGCYPTAALLALAPAARLVEPASVSVVGMSGSSGAGRGLRDDLHASHAFGNVAAYGAPTHRHTPEIAAGWGALTGGAPPVTFTPHLVPMARGLVCTATATLTGSAAAVRAAYAEAYAGEPFVTLLPAGAWPASTHVAGGNGAHVGVAVDEAAGRVVASCAIDNLVKGAAGQALQCANALLGLDETAGLSATGLYP
jgi:N-acetyl-gamma-glutamyl-phosphate reductase